MEQNAPRLRFPGFSGEWEKKPLHEIGKKITEKNKDNLVVNVLTNSAQYGLISQNDFFDKDIANQENTNKYYVIKYGDFVYNPRKSVTAPYGPIRINANKEDGIVSPLYICFRINSPETDNQYLARYFESSSWYEYIKINGNIGARNDRVSITDKVLMNMPISVPSLPEQEKIADFFSALDEKIDLKEKEIEDVKSMKKGFLQKMFPQDGESVPRLRFPGFSEEWEKKKLGEIIETSYSGGTPLTNKKSYYENGTIPFMRSGEISENSTKLKITQEGLQNSSAKMVKKGDLLYALYGGTATSATSGNCDISKIDCAINQAILCLKAQKSKTTNLYLKNLLTQNRKNILKKHLQGGQGNLSAHTVLSLNLFFPSLPEQEKIADFFFALDEKIDAIEKQLEDLKEMKKGFLQQMFI